MDAATEAIRARHLVRTAQEQAARLEKATAAFEIRGHQELGRAIREAQQELSRKPTHRGQYMARQMAKALGVR